MRHTTRLFVAAALGIFATTAACSDSTTGPPGGGGSTAGTLAQHFDTLYAHAKASSVNDTNFNFRVAALSELEVAAAFGAPPSAVTVTTSAGTEEWKGFVFSEVHNDSGAAPDSAIFIFAYRDSLVHTMILSGIAPNGSSLGGLLLTNDTLRVQASSTTGSASLTSVGSSCATPIAGLVNPLIVTDESAICLSAVFHATLTLGFPATTGVDPALTALSFPTTSFAGARFLVSSAPGAQVRIAALLRQRLRASH